MRSSFAGGLMLLTAAVPARAADIAITDGWFRALPHSVPSGGYFTLRNRSSNSVTLTEVESPACGMLMMHKSDKGQMTHVPALDVAPGATVIFAPGGYHLMCMDATPTLKPGNTVPVTLGFRAAGRVTANFQVRDATGR